MNMCVGNYFRWKKSKLVLKSKHKKDIFLAHALTITVPPPETHLFCQYKQNKAKQ